MVSGLAIQPPSASAAETGRLGAHPTTFDATNPYSRSWFIYSLPAGQTKTDSVTVVNQTDSAINVKLYPVDATTTQDGTFALRNENEPRKDVGAWVKLAKSEITLGPKDRQEVAFTITIPEHATIGDHAGGIIIQEAKPTQKQHDGMHVNIVSRLGVRIYQTVPGDQQLDLSITSFEQIKNQDGSHFRFTLSNNGNVFLDPDGEIDIKDLWGKTVETISLDNLGTVVPGKPLTTTVASSLSQPFLQRYQATLQINYSPTKAASKQISFWWVNWPLVTPLGAILVLAGIGGLVVVFKRRQSLLKDANLELVPNEHSVGHWVDLARQQKVEQLINRDKHQVLVADKEIDRVFLAHHIRLIVASILVGAIGFSVVVAIFLYNFSVVVMGKNTQPNQTIAKSAPPTPTATVQPSASHSATPSATPTPNITPIQKSSIEIAVLNGSGRPGIATTAANAIKAAGFTVTTIGNDFNAGLSETTIRYPKGQHQAAELLSDALQSLYPSVSLTEIKDNDQFTLIVL